MPPTASRHPITCLCRRGTKQRNPSNSCWMQLSHAVVGNRAKLQRAWLQSLFDAHTAALELHQLLTAKILISQNLIQLSDNTKFIVDMIINVVLLLKGHDFERYVSKSMFWFQLDHLLHDISPR